MTKRDKERLYTAHTQPDKEAGETQLGYIPLPAYMLGDERLSSGALRVYAALLRKADWRVLEAEATLTQISALSSLSPRRVSEYTGELEALGYLTIKQRYNQPNHYTLEGNRRIYISDLMKRDDLALPESDVVRSDHIDEEKGAKLITSEVTTSSDLITSEVTTDVVRSGHLYNSSFNSSTETTQRERDARAVSSSKTKKKKTDKERVEEQVREMLRELDCVDKGYDLAVNAWMETRRGKTTLHDRRAFLRVVEEQVKQHGLEVGVGRVCVACRAQGNREKSPSLHFGIDQLTTELAKSVPPRNGAAGNGYEIPPEMLTRDDVLRLMQNGDSGAMGRRKPIYRRSTRECRYILKTDPTPSGWEDERESNAVQRAGHGI